MLVLNDIGSEEDVEVCEGLIGGERDKKEEIQKGTMKVLSTDDDLGRKKKTQCREGCMAGGCDGFGARLLKLHGGCVCFKIATVDKVSCFSYSYCTQQNGSKTQLNSLSIPGKKKKGGTFSHGKQGRIPKSSLPPTSCGGLPPITASRMLIGCRAINAATRQPPRSKQGPKKARRECLAQSQSERAVCRRLWRYRTGPAARQVEGRRKWTERLHLGV